MKLQLRTFSTITVPLLLALVSSGCSETKPPKPVSVNEEQSLDHLDKDVFAFDDNRDGFLDTQEIKRFARNVLEIKEGEISQSDINKLYIIKNLLDNSERLIDAYSSKGWAYTSTSSDLDKTLENFETIINEYQEQFDERIRKQQQTIIEKQSLSTPKAQ